MAGTAVIQAGDYEPLIDTGFLQDAFTLDSATKGLLNSTEFVLDGTTEFADVTTGVQAVNIKRGRRDVGDQFSAGTMTFTLDDTFADGVFNPFDTASPFYDPTNEQPGLAPMREVTFTRYDSNNPESVVCRLHSQL